MLRYGYNGNGASSVERSWLGSITFVLRYSFSSCSVGGLMLKRWRIALVLGVAMAISVCISACGGSTTTTGSTPTANPGGPGQFACVSGSITASGSTALQPFVDAVAK